ncbi:hypothetical protein DENIT_70029 [Pseudomonas veronii]|nr:hypothetical protein DENIT_70029 [Pseudomonas veronii]
MVRHSTDCASIVLTYPDRERRRCAELIWLTAAGLRLIGRLWGRTNVSWRCFARFVLAHIAAIEVAALKIGIETLLCDGAAQHRLFRTARLARPTA